MISQLSNQDIKQREQYIYSIDQYDIFLNLNPDFYTGNIKIKLKYREEIQRASQDEKLIIDYGGEKIISVGIQTNSESQDQEEKINFQYVPNKLSLPLKEIKKYLSDKDNNLIIVIAFQNQYSQTRAEGIVNYPIEEEQNKYYIYCQGEVACTQKIFPCIDMVNFRSYYTLTVQHPSNWMVTSHNEWYKQEKIIDDITVSYFPQTQIAFPTYLFGMYVGDYIKYVDKFRYQVDINIYCRQYLLQYLDEDVKEYFKQVKYALEFMESYTGIKYPFQKFDVFFCPHYKDAGMETYGCISLDENYYLYSQYTKSNKAKDIQDNLVRRYQFNLDRVETLFHEIVHQWFGNHVSIQWWNDLFFKEGFANMFSQKILYEYYKSENGIELRSQLDQFDYLQDDLDKYWTLIHEPLNYYKYLDLMAHDDITYKKSQNIFELLEQKIYGQDKFQKILQKLLQDFKYKSISSQDLLKYFDDSITKKLLTTKGYVFLVGQNLLQIQNNGTLTLSQEEIDALNLKVFVVDKETKQLEEKNLSEIKKFEGQKYLYLLNTVDHHMIYHELDIEALKYIDSEKLMDKFNYKFRATVWKAIIFLCDIDKWVPYLNNFLLKNLQFEKDDSVLQVVLEYYIEFCDEFSEQDEEHLLQVIGQEQSEQRLKIFLFNCAKSYFENYQNLEILLIEYQPQLEIFGQSFIEKIKTKIDLNKIDGISSSDSNKS